MSIKSVNQRDFCCINLDRFFNIEFEDKSYDCCQIVNLSLSGMSVAGNFNKEQTENCLVSFVREKKAEVVRRNEEGVGVKFTSMDFDHYQVLLTALINNAELPAVILSQIPKKCPY